MGFVRECVRMLLAFWATPSNEQLFHRTRQFMGWLPASLRGALNCPFLAKTQKLKHLLAHEPCYSSSTRSFTLHSSLALVDHSLQTCFELKEIYLRE